MQILSSGMVCCLAKRSVADFEWYAYWQQHGEWRKTDAPWECEEAFHENIEKETYLTSLEREREKGIYRAWICVNEQKIGSVNRYTQNERALVGIDIYDSRYVRRGIGKEALTLWIDYLRKTWNFEEIYLETYSFNTAMIKTAESIGFEKFSIHANVRTWNNTAIDKIQFRKLMNGGEHSPALVSTCIC